MVLLEQITLGQFKKINVATALQLKWVRSYKNAPQEIEGAITAKKLKIISITLVFLRLQRASGCCTVFWTHAWGKIYYSFQRTSQSHTSCQCDTFDWATCTDTIENMKTWTKNTKCWAPFVTGQAAHIIVDHRVGVPLLWTIYSYFLV